MRALQGACFNGGKPGHFARECQTSDQARKPAAPASHDDQVNYCEATVTSECTGLSSVLIVVRPSI